MTLARYKVCSVLALGAQSSMRASLWPVFLRPPQSPRKSRSRSQRERVIGSCGALAMAALFKYLISVAVIGRPRRYPRRASEARLRRRPVDGLEVHGTEARSTIANMEDLPRSEERRVGKECRSTRLADD